MDKSQNPWSVWLSLEQTAEASFMLWMKFLMHLGHSIEEGHSFILHLSLWNSLELFSATQATPLKGIMDIRLRFPLFFN